MRVLERNPTNGHEIYYPNYKIIKNNILQFYK